MYLLNNSVSKSKQPFQLNESKHDFFIIHKPEYTSPLTFLSSIIPRLFTFKSLSNPTTLLFFVVIMPQGLVTGTEESVMSS